MISRRCMMIVCMAGLGLFLPRAEGWTQNAPVADRAPKANVVIDGSTSAYLVRFDRPIDHVRSTLAITHEGRLVATLAPRRDSAPEVLFARGETLPPGEYRLHWQVRTLTDVDTVEGNFAFEVRP